MLNTDTGYQGYPGLTAHALIILQLRSRSPKFRACTCIITTRAMEATKQLTRALALTVLAAVFSARADITGSSV